MTTKSARRTPESDESDRSRHEAAQRVRQQAAVAELGQRALAGESIADLMDAAVISVADTLEVDYTKILETLPSRAELLLRAGVGWKDGLVGSATVGSDLDSQAGYTLRSSSAVIVTDMRQETRFSGPALLHEHGVVSGVSVIIRGAREPWGVFGAHTREQRIFSRHDVNFVQSVANVIAEALLRHQAETALQRANIELEGRVRARTEQLRDANIRLREQGAFLRSIFDEVGLAVYVVDVEEQGFRHSDVNPTFVRMTGVEREQVVGKRLEDLKHLPTTVTDGMRERYETIVRSGETLEYEGLVPGKEGDAWWLVTLNPVKDEQGRVYRIIGTGLPISERKEAQLALAASEERFRAVFEQGPAGTCLLILDGWNIVDVNRRCSEVLGRSRADLTGTALPELTLCRTERQQRALEDLVARGDEGRTLTLEMTRDEGAPGVLLASVQSITFASRKHTLLVFEDVTEQERVADELREARLKVSELQDRERLELARELHDTVIQQLLGINHALAQLQRDSGSGVPPTPSGIDVYRQEVLNLVDGLRHTISDLRPAGLEEFGLKATLESFLTQLRVGRKGTGPTLSCSIADTDALSPQISRTLYRVAQEAVRNAVDHADAGQVRLELAVQPEQISLTVSDDGRGFVLPERLSALVRDNHFGLVGMEERLSLLGGELAVDTAPGNGTTVRATLPREPHG